ncbi:DgyrCDS3890 [Dimorphilus gyrociliatus]|uniref:DgyrCDS3890 n=1 Tax=Dimorphilus gyrociliatus TaxID=2664684 RepID=A0A7I8VGR6_9ANNE|nr:DgyrCDS3890 [Dimorphilus gyrociliatus]
MSHLQRVAIPIRRTMSWATYNQIIPYESPSWAKTLKVQPKEKYNFSSLPTPVHEWNIPDVPKPFRLFIKRDDLTGSTLSGNKVRKLEFLIADAVKNNYKHVITAGSFQSNHVRATAITAAQAGLKCHAVLRTPAAGVQYSGNFLLDILAGSEVYYVPTKASSDSIIDPKMKEIAEKLEKERNEKAYIIPIGASNALGSYGYISAFQELLDQGVDEMVDDIVITCGSGGSVEGLSIANLLTGSKFKIHGVCACDGPAYFYQHIQQTLDQLGLADVKAEDIADFIDGYKGAGYGTSQEEDHRRIKEICSSSGVILDPVYTNKGLTGLLGEMSKNPQRFKGQRVLYFHTGGLFNIFDGRFSNEID